MNKQQILKEITSALASSDPKGILRKLSASLEEDIRMEQASKGGKLSAAKTLARILKGVDNCHPQIKYPWLWDDHGIIYQVVLDGYQCYRLKEPLPLGDRPEDAGDPIDMNKVWPKEWEYHDQEPLPVPSAGELKAEIAIHKATGNKKTATLWRFGEGKPVVDAEFLLNLTQVFPSVTELYWKNIVAPLLAHCDEGDAIILPVRMASPADESEEGEAENP